MATYLDKSTDNIAAIFAPFRNPVPIPEKGFWKDMLGVKMRRSFMPTYGFEHWDGLTFEHPLEGDVWEYAYLFKSVREASGSYVMLSLGAGQGEWGIRAMEACRRVGVNNVHAIQVEGDKGHIDIINAVCADNGVDMNRMRVIYGVVAGKDGHALFPVMHNPTEDWGASVAAVAEDESLLQDNITMTELDKIDREAAGGRPVEFQKVPAYTLGTLMKDHAVVDFIHCDVQGSEVEVFKGGMDALRDKVKFCCIETHGRAIEAELKEMFGAHGWRLDLEAPCKEQDSNGRLICIGDGTQIWINPHLCK